MKILHTTDLHFNLQWFKWIENQQDKYDVFCISGDFLDSSKDETLLKQIELVSEWIKKFQKPLFVCSGNHDIDELENEDWLNKINTSNYYPDNCIKTINGVKFGCYAFIDSQGYYEFDDCDILITHLPPAKTKASTDENGNDWGDYELKRTIDNNIISAKIILCGHMHHPTRTIDKLKDTTIYNPGVDKKSKIPNHHEILL
jgi:Icc-related predicted phosphoesterase